MGVRETFTSEELDAIRAATRSAEERTGGELVCVVVGRCDDYAESLWRVALLGALATALAAAIGWAIDPGRWLLSPILWIGLPPVAGAGAALLATLCLPPLRRLAIGSREIDRRVEDRALRAFFDEEVFATRERTGIVLFVALFEHRVRVIADRGIRERVPETAWAEVARDLAAGIRAGDAGASAVAAVERCGELLERHGVPRAAVDVNELPDEPRLLDD